SIFSAKIFLDQNLVLYSSEPEPQTISTVGERIKLTWDTIEISNFGVVIEYKSSIMNQTFTISPSVWDIGYIPRSARKIKQKFTITNLFSITQAINVTTNATWISCEEFIILKPNSQAEVTVEVKLSSLGELKGLISFQSNISMQAVECEVRVYVTASMNSWLIVSVFLFSGIIGLVIINFFFWQRLKENKVKGEGTHSPSYDFDKLDEFLSPKERKVVEVVLKKPGLNQVTIATKTGLSKATVSRLLMKLEGKGIIDKQNVGMSTLVFINEDSDLLRYLKKDE
ncbi:MAG: helix-turn-helix transcriptional regulator, partial [Candidatus Heimdallarchaeaceae archaeon]